MCVDRAYGNTITFSYNIDPLPSLSLSVLQVRGGFPEGPTGGSGGGQLPGSTGQPLDHVAGGVPGQPCHHAGGRDRDPTGPEGPGGHCAPGHGEWCQSASQSQSLQHTEQMDCARDLKSTKFTQSFVGYTLCILLFTAVTMLHIIVFLFTTLTFVHLLHILYNHLLYIIIVE